MTKEHRDWYRHDSGHWCANCHCKERHAKNKVKLEDRDCKHCGETFKPKRKDSTYCTKLCGDRACRAKTGKDATNQYFRDKYRTDLNRKLSQAARTRINKALNGSYKWHGTIESLGCSPEELKKHIEDQFTEDMTWDNWSLKGWHIDHIIPFDSFDLEDEQEYLIACNYKNLQPLWATKNLSKGKKT